MEEVTSDVLNQRPKESLKNFIDTMSKIRDVDKNLLSHIEDQIKFYKGAKDCNNPIQYLEDKWFDSIKENNDNIDYSVYTDENYCVDAWACWVIYSRKTLRSINKKKYLFGDVKTVLDIGNGIGKTTSAITEIWPEAKVIGTNIKDTEQWKVCKEYQKEYSFDLLEDSLTIGKVDIVFASEYFEHILSPIEHLDDIIKNNDPEFMIIANSFGTKGIGHFHRYNAQGEEDDGKKIGFIFNKRMREHGYEKIKTGFWNDKPNIWKKIKGKI